MAFTLGVWARHPHVPRSREGSSRRGYRIPLVRTDHLLAAPKATLSWRFDSQVSPSAGHQLRGRLAASPTGLPPASPAQLSGHIPPQKLKSQDTEEKAIREMRLSQIRRSLRPSPQCTWCPRRGWCRCCVQLLVRVTSSRYIQVSSEGLGPSRWTLNHRVTFWPLNAVRLAVTWVQLPLLLLSLNSVDRLVPLLSRTCPSIQSCRQIVVPPQVRSLLCGWYQTDRVVVPTAGTVTVCESVLSPSGSRPLVTPSRAEPAPLCALVACLGAIAPRQATRAHS